MENVVASPSTQEVPSLTKRDKIGLGLIGLAVAGAVVSSIGGGLAFFGYLCQNVRDDQWVCQLGLTLTAFWAYVGSLAVYIIGAVVTEQKRFRKRLFVGGLVMLLIIVGIVATLYLVPYTWYS